MKEIGAVKPIEWQRKWVTITLWIHKGRVRVAKLLPMRVEPGRRFVPGPKPTIVRGRPYRVLGAGYEGGGPAVHLLVLS